MQKTHRFCGVFLFESCCIAAAVTKLLRGIAGAEAFINGLCPGGIQNVIQILRKEIAQSNIALMIQTAGDNSAIAKHTNMVAHTIAEYPIALNGCG